MVEVGTVEQGMVVARYEVPRGVKGGGTRKRGRGRKYMDNKDYRRLCIVLVYITN